MDKAKKKTIKRVISWVALAALVAGLAVMPLIARQEEEADGPVASILEATAQTGQVSTVLKGGGTLTAGKAKNVKLPSGVKIKEFLVKNGELVTEGTPVATVDRVSVMNAILSVEDTLEYLQEQITAAKDDKVSGTIRATAGGKVKQVFAEPGDSVQNVMLEHGALAVLSLDGRMAVALERDMNLAAGDSAVVMFSDGTEVNGRVESNLNGKIVISIEDDDYAVGEAVTVETEDGDRIGKGELYVHNAWSATAFSGTVSTVYAKENTEVNEGATLLTLKDTDYLGTMESLASLHREYEEQLQELFAMYESEVLTAPCDGMISGVDENSDFLLSSVKGEDGWFVDLLSNETTNGAEKGWTVIKLSSSTTCTKNPEKGQCSASIHEEGCYYFCTGSQTCTAEEHKLGCYYFCTGLETCTAKPGEHTNCLSQCQSVGVIGTCPNSKITDGVHKKDCIDGCTSSDDATACTSDIHKPDCIGSCITSAGDKDCPATKHHHQNCIERCDKKETCQAVVHYSSCLTRCTEKESCTAECHKSTCYYAKLTYKGKAFWVWQAGTDGRLIGKWDTGTVYEFTMGASGIQLINPPKLATNTLITDGTISGSGKSGDVIMVWEAYNEKGENVKSGQTRYANLPVQAPGGMDFSGMLGGLDISGMFSGMMGGISFGNFGSYGAFAGAGQTQTQLYDLNGNTLLTVTERDAMTLTIAIDEHDIAKVSLGQTADVNMTALKGETFEAEVTEIGNYGTNNGGSSKFTVELTMSADERMLAGMNATATIPLFTKMDVLTIPVAALVETVDGTVVHTALDPKTGEPASPVAVETGVSDGETVEILSGLNSGDRIYYSYYDVVELDHTAKTEYSFR